MADTSENFLNKYKDDPAKLVDLARVMETAERFDDMCHIMGLLVKAKKGKGEALEVEERNMLSVAYKNVVGGRRASWRTLSSDDDNSEGDADLKKKYKEMVEEELAAKCNEVLDLIKNNLIDKSVDENKVNAIDDLAERKNLVETQVFYLKMCGDYNRYLAEFKDEQEVKNAAINNYNGAINLAKLALAETHPTRLGLALNASVCYYEIMKQPKKACDLAKGAFDDAIQKLDSLSDSTYKDSTLIMQLLRDNLTIWSTDEANDTQED